MTPAEEDQAHAALVRHLEGQPPILLEIDMPTAVLVVGNLQLALRHPDNTAAGSVVIRKFARELQERIAPVGSPVYSIMEEGWDG